MVFIQQYEGKANGSHKENEQTNATNSTGQIILWDLKEKILGLKFESFSLKWYRINEIGVGSLLSGSIRVY